MEPSSYSAETVDGNGDLLTEILRRLPNKPLAQFKTVNKRWLSLISDRRFSLLHVGFNNPTASALILCSSDQYQQKALVPFDNFFLSPTHFHFLTQPGITIMHSCNGFFCYSKLEESRDRPILEYFICNATTKKSVKIPLTALVYFSRRHRGKYRALHKIYKLNIEEFNPENYQTINVLGMYVAFDPQNSPHYKVVCVWESNSFLLNYEIKIEVYRSETGSWGETLGPFRIPYEISFNLGVFWNDGMHWISKNYMVCFNIDIGELKVISLPLISTEWKPIYIGNARGHLYVVVVDENSIDPVLNVYEMERDYSLWVLRFSIPVKPILVLAPEIQLNYNSTLSLIYLGRGENTEEPHFILRINDKLMSYCVKSKTLKKLCDLPQIRFYNRGGWAPADCHKSFVFHETILEV